MAVTLIKETKQKPKQEQGGTKVSIPSIFKPIFEPNWRYIVLKGGRGSGKSTAVAMALLILGAQQKLRILCTREMQKSIKDSVKKLLDDKIEEMNLRGFYESTDSAIRGANGTEFFFMGLYSNINQIKSTEGVDICWVEEAQTISRESLDILIPTIRKQGSRIFFTFNPEHETDPVYQDFVINKPDNCLLLEVNYWDNPYFPDTLRKEMEHCKKTDLDKWNWIWAGKCKTQSDAQVFKGKFVVCEFEPKKEDEVPYYGADWGFSTDPSVLIRCFIRQEGQRKILCIDYEAGGVGIEIDKMKSEMFAKVPGALRYRVYGDSARPETISFLKRQGINIKGVKKMKGSVESGIEFLRSFDQIQIHPRCEMIAEEFRLYSYKKDKLTGNILPDIEDKHNHGIDALRYALSDVIRCLGSAGRIELTGSY